MTLECVSVERKACGVERLACVVVPLGLGQGEFICNPDGVVGK